MSQIRKKKQSILIINSLISFFIFVVTFIYLKRDVAKKEQTYLTDPLTGGFNREGFIKTGNQYMTISKHLPYAVVCLNICNFRQINELWGEENGNQTLKFIYRIFRESIDSSEVLCRSSIDHFMLLLYGETEEILSERVSQMINRVNTMIQKDSYEYSLDFKVGGCQISKGQNLTSAVSNAIYASKNSAEKNRCNFYDSVMIQKIVYENELDKWFYDSIKNRDFKIFLQPKVSSKEPCQAEALVRWLHPEKGMIYPDQFIPMFEENGKIAELDLYVFEETCRLIAGWIRQGQQVTKISVNISRFTLQKLGRKIWKKYNEIKEKYQIPDWIIEMEITETTLLSGNEISYIQHILDGFHSCGLKVALDDFGVAYSSLALLKAFDVDTIKLDRSFFVDENQKSNKIIASIIQLSHNLGMCVVAEGIEEFSQVEVLCESGCDFIQGYVYSKPLSVEMFMDWRKHHESSHCN